MDDIGQEVDIGILSLVGATSQVLLRPRLQYYSK